MADRLLLQTRSGRVLAGAVAALFAVTLTGLVILWPSDAGGEGGDPALSGPSLAAAVTAVRSEACPGSGGQTCRSIEIRVEEWPAAGVESEIALGPEELTPSFAVGDQIRVREVAAPPGVESREQFAFVDRERRTPLLWLAAAFSILIVAMARWRGFWALIGFALSLALVVWFLVPGMLVGEATMAVALIGCLAVMFVTVLLTYGLAPQSFAAILGIAASLAVAAGLGSITVNAAGLDGKEGELAAALATGAEGISLQGIVLAGMVLAALGVIADTAVTQASAVLALRRADPAQSWRQLYFGGFAVGRDHLVATTHTLVLVYVGASLPLLLALEHVGVSLTDALNSQEVAEPIVAMLVGSIALLLSVPLTTALAAYVVGRMPAEQIPTDTGHTHPH